MKAQLFVATFYLITLVGCAPIPSVKGIPPSSTNTVIQPTPTPSNRLQITYLNNNKSQNFAELHMIDITCMSNDKVCLSETKLLFQTLKAGSSEQDKPRGMLFDNYSWSPDGSKIVLISNRDVFIGNINTQEWTNITNTREADHEPKWSTNGKFIYYIACIEDLSGMCTPQLIKYDLASKQKLQLLQAWNKSFSSDYAISPDGQKIIFSINNDVTLNKTLYLANWDGTDSHPITTAQDADEFAPSFSPDGQKIAVFRKRIKRSLEAKDEWDIIVKDLISGEEKNLTENFDGLAASPIFSPDGKWFAFEANDSESNWNIFLVSLETGNIIQVTQGNNETNPAWRQFSK